MKTVIGLFRDREEAIATIADLKRVGAHDGDISVLSRDPVDDLAGIHLDSVTIPGMGQLAAGGPLTTFLHTGAAESSPDLLTAALVRMGIPRDEAVRYVEGVRQGCTLETVSIDDEHANEALAVMQAHAVPGDERSDLRSDTQNDVEQRIPIVEEDISVGKEEVSAGGVRVATHVEEEPVEERVELQRENVDVERRPVNRDIAAGDDAFRERTVEVTARAERPVVAKQARVVEEIVVRKDVQRDMETVRDTIRRTEADVQHLDADESVYREHYDREIGSRFAGSDDGHAYDYESYKPAYAFGHGMRGDRRFQGESWDDVEPNARSAWEERNPGTWERMKMAVRHAWERAKA